MRAGRARAGAVATLATVAAGVIVATCAAACGGERRAAPSATAPSKISPTTSAARADPHGIVEVGAVPPHVAAMTERIWRLAARARHLTSVGPVKLKVLSPIDLVDVVKVHVAAEIPREVIRGEGECYEALGLVPRNYDYEAETYALLEEELAGLFMPEDNTMYLSRAVDREELEATLSHELVHALQDQHFHIGKGMKYVPGESDSLGALHALAEGDATSAMIDEMILARAGERALEQKNASDFPDQEPEDLLRASIHEKKKGARIAAAPRFIALGLLAPYADGLRFVNALRRRGGWRAVDEAWAHPPTTTEQLVHLDKYDQHEPAIPVRVATSAALGTSWKKTFDDLFGEQGARLAFAEWMNVDAAKRAADGWGGDRVTLFDNGAAGRAVAWQIVFDTRKDELEAFSLVAEGWDHLFGAGTSTTAPPGAPGAGRDAGSVTRIYGDAPAIVRIATTPKGAGGTCRALRGAGTRLTIVAGVPCAAAAAWSAEVGDAR